MKTHSIRVNSEEGAAIVELVMVIPVLIVLIAGILDLGLLIKCNIAADAASTALARRCMDDPSLIDDSQELNAYLNIVEPGLAGADVVVSTGEQKREGYTYSVYPDESENRITRASYNSYVPFTVTINYAGSFFTPIGRGISYAGGGDGTLVVSCSQSGRLDTTSGATW